MLQLLAQCIERLLDFLEALVPGEHNALLVRFELFRLSLAYACELDAGDLILHFDRGCEHAQSLVDFLSDLLGQRADLLGILLTFYFSVSPLILAIAYAWMVAMSCGHLTPWTMWFR